MLGFECRRAVVQEPMYLSIYLSSPDSVLTVMTRSSASLCTVDLVVPEFMMRRSNRWSRYHGEKRAPCTRGVDKNRCFSGSYARSLD